jgi:hypothetical protein
MLPPEAVARLLEALLTLGQPPRHPKLPVNTRFYYSGADHLGVTYQSLGNRPPDFFHLVGQAYRQAGGALLGLTPSFPDFQAQPPTTSTQRQIAALLACLQTCGHDFEISVEVANALKPLAAFQAQLQGQTTPRQASRWFTQVHNHLSKCLAVSLEPPALAAIEANSFVGEGHDLARNYC